MHDERSRLTFMQSGGKTIIPHDYRLLHAAFDVGESARSLEKEGKALRVTSSLKHNFLEGVVTEIGDELQLGKTKAIPASSLANSLVSGRGEVVLCGNHVCYKAYLAYFGN
jgi:hypothetical protein